MNTNPSCMPKNELLDIQIQGAKQRYPLLELKKYHRVHIKSKGIKLKGCPIGDVPQSTTLQWLPGVIEGGNSENIL
jgi:hypothetical protein